MTETVPVAIRLRLGRQRTSSTDTPVDIDTGHLLDEVRDRTAEAVTPGWWCATTPGPTTSASSAFDPHRGFENLLRVVEDARLIHGLAVAQRLVVAADLLDHAIEDGAVDGHVTYAVREMLTAVTSAAGTGCSTRSGC